MNRYARSCLWAAKVNAQDWRFNERLARQGGADFPPWLEAASNRAHCICNLIEGLLTAAKELDQ